MKRLIKKISIVALAVVLPTASAENWPQFRGADSNFLPAEERLPVEWSDANNVRWTAHIPGRGWSSPITWGNKVFVTAAVPEKEASRIPGRDRVRAGNSHEWEYRWEIYCFDLRSGEELWKRVAVSGLPSRPTHDSNTYASETPVTDGERLYVYFGMMGLYCYDLDGELSWSKDLGVYPTEGNWGTATSPLLFEDTVYMQIDNQENSFLAALDSRTGEEKWRIWREETTNWSTPMIWRNKTRTELITSGKTIRSYDPRSAELLWELRLGGGRSSASPVGNEDFLYVGNEARGGGGSLHAVRAGASGDITPPPGESTSPGVMWSQAGAGPQFSSPLLYEDHIYILERRRGQVSCYDAMTGEAKYRLEDLPGARAFWASPWAFDGRVFCPDDTGTTHVLRPGAKFEILWTNSIKNQFWASPAFTDGVIILRGVDRLYCIEAT